MSEETTETATPDYSTFDISDWLTSGTAGRTTETVTVYRDPSMLDQARRLQVQAEKINARTELEPEDLAIGEESEASRVQAELDELEQQIRATKAEVAIRALSDGEVEDIAVTFKKRYPIEKREWSQTVKGTCLVLAAAATFNGEKLTADQWRQLSEGPLAGGQWQRIKQAHLVAQNKTPRADNPFS